MMDSHESELESFRQRWREEVSARRQQPAVSRKLSEKTDLSNGSQQRRIAGPPPASVSDQRNVDINGHDDWEPRTYHDLPDKEEALRLSQDRPSEASSVPYTALDHYEKAVEKETLGNLGDSVSLYRKAFKLDSQVHESYKNKHFPTAKPAKPTGTLLPHSGSGSSSANTQSTGTQPSISELILSFSELSIPPAAPPTDADPPPPCPIASLPAEILSEILLHTALTDIASLTRLAQVCKRMAYLISTEQSIWRRVTLGSEFGFGAMHWRFACMLPSKPVSTFSTRPSSMLTPSLYSTPKPAPSLAYTEALLRSTYRSSWLHMFRSRPRIRFNGVYISTVNYTRPGASSSSNSLLTWTSSPVLIVTYYRYLRFFRDGRVLSLLTTLEPTDVVHHLTRDALDRGPAPSKSMGDGPTAAGGSGGGGGLPGAQVVRDALRGRWRISGPVERSQSGEDEVEAGSGEGVDEDLEEPEGDVHVETEGVVPRYVWKMQFALWHAGKSARNNKLVWKGFWSYNKLTDDWGEFGLRNDRAFYFSRVKSYGNGD